MTEVITFFKWYVSGESTNQIYVLDTNQSCWSCSIPHWALFSNLICNILEFMAHYVGLILAPAEGFGAIGPYWVAFSHWGGPLCHHLPYLPLYRGHNGTQNFECTTRFRSQYSMVTLICWPLLALFALLTILANQPTRKDEI